MSRQARSLDVMLAEINKHAPNRSTASDGGIGDPAHAARVSKHNPGDDGVWEAYDVTDSPERGLDGSDLAHRAAALLGKHPAMMAGAHVIHNGHIISFNRLDEGWRLYFGENDHETHVHIAVSDAPAGYDSIKPWNLWSTTSAPAKPVIVNQPTILDITKALERWELRTTNPKAAGLYKSARENLGSLVSSDRRVRMPSTVAGVIDVLEAKLDLVDEAERRARLESAIALLRPLAVRR